MPQRYEFPESTLITILGGRSSIDIPQLDIKDLDRAHEFALTYGYDLTKPSDLEKVWSLHHQAVTLIRDRLLDKGEEIPDLLADSEKLKDPGMLLVLASTQRHPENIMQMWACCVLRVMHVFAHLESDLFSAFEAEIQEQILRPVQNHIVTDSATGAVTLGLKGDSDQIKLKRFDVKPAKSNSSSAIKLLAKPEAVALTLLDKIGMRFVTRGVYDCFRVMRFLVNEHMVSFPNVIPDQSRNNYYPVNIFFEVMDQLKIGGAKKDPSDIERILHDALLASLDRAEFKEKRNDFSGENYRSMKFIGRRLVGINVQDRQVRFFYPFEVQVVDYETYVQNISGPQSHSEYKKRQRQAARLRALGPLAGVPIS